MSRRQITGFVLALVWLSPALVTAAPDAGSPGDGWLTLFERTQGQQTPRYAETVDYCRRLAADSPKLFYSEFGTSPRGRGLPLVVADRGGRFTPAEVATTDNAVILVQACIHAGESCGKDAGLMLLRDLAFARELGGLLEHVTLLLIPIFNVDGHERFGPYNRINQNGPEEMGWRVTAQNLNLNRDYLKADTPEMRAWLELFTAWRPDFFVDIHSTDGADYQYAVTYAMETFGNMDPGVTAWTRDYLERIEPRMTAAGFPVSPYVTFRRWHDPRSGLVAWSAPPRLSQGYTALHDVPGLLIETHMLKDYRIRVEGAYQMLRHTLALVNEDHRGLRQVVAEAWRRRVSPDFRKGPVPLAFESTADSVMLDFLGVEYEVIESEVTGGQWFRYGSEPRTFRLPFFNQLRPTVAVELPAAYLIPPEWTEVIDRLAIHGVACGRLSAPVTRRVRSYRFVDASWQERPYEGRHRASFTLETIHEDRIFPAGTVVVDLRQPAAKVAANVLEPAGPDSYASWGFFDAVLARVEYVESYVIEEMARRLLADDPELRDRFEQKLAEDPEFAGDTRAIRDWFYRRTPYYDDRFNVYPVGMVDEWSAVDELPLKAVE